MAKRKGSSLELPEEGRQRVVIEAVTPQVDGGRFAAKRVVGEEVIVEADVFADGHDRLACAVLYRHETDSDWTEVEMTALPNDRWRAGFKVDRLGRYHYSVIGWVDAFASWRHDFHRRPDDDPDVAISARVGAALLHAVASHTSAPARAILEDAAVRLESKAPIAARRAITDDADLAQLVKHHAERRFVTRYARDLAIVVNRERARVGAWYEFFPRSCKPGGHGRFTDCDKMLAYVADMGFDVVYLPPIHPIGRTLRKGPNNLLSASRDDVGSPWAIGGAEGGHKSIHPDLGTLDDFRRFVKKANTLGLDIALDIAFQCSPDHPYIKEHPEWFRRRPDGSIQYAENPPKKYQDIYQFDYETDAWEALWWELKSVLDFWVEQGVRIFRVDNPHTKSFALWEWLITGIQRAHPDVIFLAEAFTRPKVMHRLAKLGFSQSYTYFTWRNTKSELIEYFTELTQQHGREYFFPNVWPNTPDILSEYLQFGGRPAFMVRLVLAATLAASYGIYGPAFELAEARARDPGSEEYADSEKYQIRNWDLERPDSLRDFIARVNRIRRDNPALQSDWGLEYHKIDNDRLFCYSKASADGTDTVLVVVNLDPHHRQSGWVELPLEQFGLTPGRPYQMHDLLSDARFLWDGARNYVELDPQMTPAHIFRLRRRVHREHDFDYYL
jgi:starch synthase (maltosyl-transferring)